MDVADLFVIQQFQTSLAGSIMVSAKPEIKGQILLFWVGLSDVSFIFAHSLSFDVLDKWNINNPFSASIMYKIRSCHGIPDSLFCFFLSGMK
jgi:hypothetical protein